MARNVWIGILVIVGLAIVGYFAYPTLKGIAPILSPTPPLRGESLPFNVPNGFRATLYTSDAPGARVIVRDPDNTIVASLMNEGEIAAYPDENGDGIADERISILTGLDSPHGIQFRCGVLGTLTDNPDECYLFVAEESRVAMYSYNAETNSASFERTLIELPDDGGHFTRSLFLHPDGKRLLVSIGSSCNVCIEADERRAAILAVDMVTGDYTVYAKGLRNTVFMALNPLDGTLWGTDMGRDWLGDDIPPDEVNIIREGGNYGWPICYGKNVHDTDFDKNTYIRDPCSEPFETPPLVDIPAHSAPLGIAFLFGYGWPLAYRGSALVAYHGSWNRSEPAGYKIVRVPVDESGAVGEPLDFMTGFLTSDGTVLGRPAGIMAEPNAVYVTDDRADAIYMISYTGGI